MLVLSYFHSSDYGQREQGGRKIKNKNNPQVCLLKLTVFDPAEGKDPITVGPHVVPSSHLKEELALQPPIQVDATLLPPSPSLVAVRCCQVTSGVWRPYE